MDSSKGVMRPDPEGRLQMAGAEVKHRWKAVGLKDPRVQIEGDQAVVTGRVRFGGEGAPPEVLSGVIIRYRRQAGRWKYIEACMGTCDLQ